MDLFSIKPTIVKHILTDTDVLAIRSVWIKGRLHFKCLVPQLDEKKNPYMASATYSDSELLFTA